MSIGGEDVLERQRHAGQRRRGRGAGGERARRPARPTASAASAATCRNACTVPSTAAIRSRWACATSTADTSREWIFSASSAAVRRVSVAAQCLLPQDLRHAEAPVLGGGGAGQRLLLGEAGAALVGAEDVLQRHGVRRRRDVVGGDLADAGDGAEDDVELAGEQVELRVGDGEPGEPGEVRDLVPADPARGVGGHVPPRSCGTHRRGHGRGTSTSPRRSALTRRRLLDARLRSRCDRRPGAVSVTRLLRSGRLRLTESVTPPQQPCRRARP